MESFINDKQYKKLKTMYEKEYFKLFGEYCWYDGDKLINKSKAHIEEYFKNKKITIEYTEEKTTKKGTTTSTVTPITKSFYQVWSEDPKMLEYKEIIFDCDVSNVKNYQFNLFKGFNHFEETQSEKIDLSLIFEHIRSLVDYKEADFNYVISWLAQLVQQPHILPHTCLIFISDEGVGKDIFAKFLSKVLSEKYTHNTEKLELICGKFNTVLAGKLLMVVNETNPVESRERIENIKFLVTAEDVTIEGKHKDAIKAKNYARFVFFSNRLFAFPVEEKARRPKILKSSSKYLPQNIGDDENEKFFTKLVNMYKSNKYQQAFLNYLKKYDISTFNPKKFEKSELHQELEESSISPIVGYLAETIKTNKKNEVLRLPANELMASLKSYMLDKGYKYDFTPAKLSVELTMTYGIKKIKNSCILYEFNLKSLKELLETKYKYSFDEVDPEEISLHPELDGKTKREVELEKEVKQLKQQIEDMKKQVESLKNKDVEQNSYQEIFIKGDINDDLEAELEALTSSEKKQPPCVIEEVSSLDDLREIELQLKNQKKKKNIKIV